MRVACKFQRDAEWFQVKTGKIGASSIHKAMSFLTRASGSKKAGESSAVRDQFILELATELITRVPMEHYVSRAMDIGTQFEGKARIEYWQATGTEVEETGFVLHPSLDYAGASPDGLIGTDGGLEIKVPLLHTHMGYIRSQEIPDEYQKQMQFNMLCCERQWWDFCSYCPPEVYPEVPDRFRLYVQRLKADEAMHEAMTDACVKTMGEVTELVKVLSERCPDRQRRERPEQYVSAEQAEREAMEVINRSELVP